MGWWMEHGLSSMDNVLKHLLGFSSSISQMGHPCVAIGAAL